MDQLKSVAVKLEISGEPSLLILLYSDGTINRKGDGTMVIDKNFYIGMTDTKAMLEELRKMIDEEFAQYLNMVYELPDKLGQSAMVEIVLGLEPETKGTRFIYSTDGIGPPAVIKRFVMRAIELTDPWFRQQKRMVRKSQKKWWEFWK